MAGARRRIGCERGTVMVEFIIVLIPMLLFFLGVTQLAMLSAARLVVRHAAVVGARAAVVAFEDDHEDFAAERKGQILGEDGELGLRSQQVVAAVEWPMAAVSSTFRQWAARRVGNALDGIGQEVGSRALLKGEHADAFVAVTFPTGPGAEGEDFHRQDDYGPADDITVRVTLLYQCVIPMASRYMCHKGYEILTGLPIDSMAGAAQGLLRQEGEIFDAAMSGDFERVRELSGYDDVRQAQDRLAGSEQWVRELDRVDTRSVQTFEMLSQKRFMVLRAEATLPNQGAPYYPREAQDGQGD